jgi:methylmalonyl-CoA mutase N-terminal domain/subunit
MDEALALPTEEAVKVALRTQQILAHETGLTEVVDPLAGSYFIEYLTAKMVEESEKIFAEIERRGGMVPAIEQGYPQLEIAKASYQFQKDLEDRRYINVGVNEYVEAGEKPLPLLKIDPRVEREQVAAVQAFKARREAAQVARASGEIRQAAAGGANLMPPILSAVKEGVTLGEIVDTLRQVFGEWREPPIYW